MFCIAAFIILAIISIFSASHRKLAKKAWECTFKKITFRACDTSFKEETKNKLLAKVAVKTPKLIKIADIGIEIASFAFVILTIWSLLVAFEAGLNLFVWGTCTPNQASACSLGSETCSISKVEKNFWQLTSEGKPHEWFINKASDFVNTVVNIPTRLKSWNATEYLPQNASYYTKYNDSKPTALEIIDPGCVVCSQLFKNIKESEFHNAYNLTYIAYPIKNPEKEGEYTFKNSYLITQYLEAIKLTPLKNVKVPIDWQIIERIFTEKDEKGTPYQNKINSLLNNKQTEKLLIEWLEEFGYNNQEIQSIKDLTASEKVKNIIDDNYRIVEEEIRTVMIPTIIFNNKRHGGLVQASSLK